jgi:alkanesulfonate monooxygenase
MILAYLPSNPPPFAWRSHHDPNNVQLDFSYYKRLAQTAERGKFHAFFLTDGLSVREDRIGLEGMKGHGIVANLEVLTLLSALAVVTERIGLVATVSTTYNEPYHLARKFATIDHISQGRAGWNIITSSQDAEAFNFGLEAQWSNEVRYERAQELLQVALDLWDSWEEDAIQPDRTTHTFFDPKKVHYLNHQGKYFKVRGPLNVARSPQGHPVLCQAGASEAGWEFAARTADLMFGKAITLGEAQKFYAGVKSRLAKYGRPAESLKILPGLIPVVGRTEKEAREKFRAVQDGLTHEEGMHLLTHIIPGIDFSDFPLDETIPRREEIDQAAVRFRIFLERDGRRLTVRELLDDVSAGIGHLNLIGTPGQIADTLTEWFIQNGADGFALKPHGLTQTLEDFVDLVIPELQSRGVFRKDFEGVTFRENLGLPCAPNRFNRRK